MQFLKNIFFSARKIFKNYFSHHRGPMIVTNNRFFNIFKKKKINFFILKIKNFIKKIFL